MKMSTPDNPSNPETVLFRPSKKRKIYRQRSRAPSEEAAAATTQDPSGSSIPTSAVPEQTLDELISSEAPSTEDAEGTRVPISEILRLRRQRKARVGGVEFRAAVSPAVVDGGGEMVVREEDGEEEAVARTGEVRKFAPQTGMIGDVNKHM